MKIKTADRSYDEVIALPRPKYRKPRKTNLFFKTLLKLLVQSDIKATSFTWKSHGMERLADDEPFLILMNHSSFIDLKIAAHILYPRSYNIICTSDGFVGQEWLLRRLGCIPTEKFVSEVMLARDMHYALHELKCPVLMYPEASYSFDGTQTPLPDSLGKCLKFLKVPVVSIITHGAFARDPLYNNLQLRKVQVSADMTYLLSPDEIAEKPVEELNKILNNVFTFDNFRWQQENGIRISEPFRADGLNRVLYKCPHCSKEGQITGKGIHLTCNSCSKIYELTELGYLAALDGDTAFDHVPDWYAWERNEVRREIERGEYHLSAEVDIYMMVDFKQIYKVGCGKLTHSSEGFHLTGCDGKIDFRKRPIASYGLYADYNWYEIGDMICLGDQDKMFYLFPKNSGDIVAKTRLAAEELYKLAKNAQQPAFV